MPNMPDSYYDNFNASKNYEKILYRDGYTLQGAELNEAQSAAMHRLQGVADALFKDGDIIRDAGIIVNKETGEVRARLSPGRGARRARGHLHHPRGRHRGRGHPAHAARGVRA